MPVVQPESRRRRSVRRRGLDPALVQSFPTYTHDAEKLARGISQTPKSEQPRLVPSSESMMRSFAIVVHKSTFLIAAAI